MFLNGKLIGKKSDTAVLLELSIILTAISAT